MIPTLSLGQFGLRKLRTLGNAGTPFTVGPLTTLTRNSTAQSIPNATWTAISYDTVVQDNPSAFSGGSPTIITVPSGYTRVRVTSYVTWDNNSTGNRYHEIIYDSATVRLDVRKARNETCNTISAMFVVAATKTFQIQVHQTSGAALNLGGPNGSFFTGPSTLQLEWFA
jgi:uncharacterized protein YaiE (UPF0345 family)